MDDRYAKFVHIFSPFPTLDPTSICNMKHNLVLILWLFFSLLLNAQKDLLPEVLSEREQARVIDEILGDRLDNLLHVDFGITYLRLNTDKQQHFYVLRPGETDAPEGLKSAFRNGNRVQDILTANFLKGRTGNQILKASLDQAKAERLNASIYTHPIGFHGHAAGPTIGMWDKQQGVKGTGDYPLYENTAYSIELFAATEVSEWDGKIVRIMLEEDGVFDGEDFYFLDGRQKELMLIPAARTSVGH